MDEQPDYVERERAYQRAYYLKHREKKIAYQRSYWGTHKDGINASRKKPSDQWKNRRRGIQVSSKAEYNKRYHQEVLADRFLRERVRALQRVSGIARPVCLRCGEQDVRVLAMNHRNGDGAQERRARGRDGRWMTRAIALGQREVDDLEVLCFNCNIRFEYERGRRHLPRDWQSSVDEEVAAWQEPLTR